MAADRRDVEVAERIPENPPPDLLARLQRFTYRQMALLEKLQRISSKATSEEL